MGSSMSGWFSIERDVFEHEFFRKQPFTDLLVWIWMIREASWDDRRVRVGRVMVDLRRGQFAHSRRHLATTWMLTESKVRTLLKEMQDDGMILVETTADFTRITICNYDEYQHGSPAERQPDASRTQTERQPNASPWPKDKETNNLTNIDDGDEAREQSARQSACDLADEVAVACGHDLAFVPPAWCGAANRVEMWLANGWPRDVIMDTVRGVMARKRDGPPDSIAYFEKPIAKAVAMAFKPLPKVVIDNTPETVRVRTQANQSASRSAENILARLEEFDAADCGSGASPSDVRLLSKG